MTDRATDTNMKKWRPTILLLDSWKHVEEAEKNAAESENMIVKVFNNQAPKSDVVLVASTATTSNGPQIKWQ